MKHTDNTEKKMSTKKKIAIASVAGLFAAIGAIFGVIAYYQQWLG